MEPLHVASPTEPAQPLGSDFAGCFSVLPAIGAVGPLW